MNTRTATSGGRLSALMLSAVMLALGCGVDDIAHGEDATPSRRERPPNIVLLISDDHDYEQLGFLGHPLPITPTLDALAAGGAVFPVAYSQSRCRPTLAGLLSGREAHQHGVYANRGPEPLRGPGLLPELLRDAGYLTYGQGKLWEGKAQSIGFTNGTARGRIEFVRSDGQRRLFKFLDSVGDNPFFLWWAPQMPHLPHDPPDLYREIASPADLSPPDYVARYLRKEWAEREALSLAMVRWFDAEVGRLVEKIRDLGLERDTLFVFLIDNGWSNGLPSKGSPYEKGIRTPLILSFPGQITAGQRIDALSSHLDLMPTLLEYAGVPLPDGLAGHSLRPWLEGESPVWRERLYGGAYSRVKSRPTARPEDDLLALYARDERFKYVLYLQDLREDRDAYLRIHHHFAPFPVRDRGDEELFDLDADPYEFRNLAGLPEYQEIRGELRSGVLDWWTKTGGGDLP